MDETHLGNVDGSRIQNELFHVGRQCTGTNVDMAHQLLRFKVGSPVDVIVLDNDLIVVGK